MTIEFDDLIPKRAQAPQAGPSAELSFDDLIPNQEQAFTGQPTELAPGQVMEPGAGRTAARLGGLFAQGANEGLISLLELPYDAINNAPRLLNLLPGVDTENGGGFDTVFEERDPGVRMLRDLLGRIEPETPGERVTERIGNEVGMSAVPQAGLTMRAANLPRQIGAAGNLSAADRAFTLPFRDAPTRANLVETATAVGAGAGAGVGAEAHGEGTLEELLYAIVGGAGTGAGINLVDNIARTGRSIATDAPAREAVGEQLTRAAADPNKAFSGNTQRRAAQSADELPGMNLTTGQASGDPGVLAMEYSRSTGGPNIGLYDQRRTGNNAAVRNSFEETAPIAKDDLAARGELTSQRDQQLQGADSTAQARAADADAAAGRQAELEGQRDTAQREFQEDYDDVASQRDLKESGSAGVAEAYSSARASTARERRAAYEAAQEAGTTKVDSAQFSQETDAIMKDIGPLADSKDPALMRLVRDIEDLEPGSAVTVADIIDMQPRLSRAMKNANGAMRGDTVRQLGQLNDKMRTTLDELAELGDEGAMKWQEANRLSREEAPLFRRGKGGQMDKKSRKGEDVADSAAANEFIGPDKPGRPETLKQLRQILDKSDDPAAAGESVREYVIGSLADSLAGRRSPSVEAVDNFVRKNSQVLREFPEVNKEITQMRNRLNSKSTKVGQLEDDIRTATTGAKAAREEAARAGKDAEKTRADLTSDKTTIGRYLNREKGADSMSRILSAGKPREEADKLMTLVKGNTDAAEGVRRAFFDNMEQSVTSTKKDSSDNPLFKKDAFIKFMNKNGDVADRVLGKEHGQHLRRISKELDVLQRTTNAKPPGSSGTAAGNQGAGLTMNSILSRIYGINRGVVSPRFVVSEVAARLVSSAAKKAKGGKINELLDDALLDPEVARTLVMEYSKENDRLIAKRLPALIKRLGARTARAEAATEIPASEEDDSEDDAD